MTPIRNSRVAIIVAYSLLSFVTVNTAADAVTPIPKPGVACSNLNATAQMSGATLACRLVGKKKVWVNIDGGLHITTASLPAAISGRPYTARIAAAGGTPPYECVLKSGSVLPVWASLNLRTCQITGIARVLSGGTTRSTSPPFTITVRDSATPRASKNVTLTLTIVLPSLTLTLTPVVCTVQQACNVQIARATGGTVPYSFRPDSFAAGAPPLGMFIQLNGFLSGTPSVAGVYTVGVCVTDRVAASSCKTTTVTVNEANTAALTVYKVGTGTGTSYSNPGGTPCISNCSAAYPLGTSVTIIAIPAADSTFTGWSGACTGTASCVVVMNSDQNVTATFTLLPVSVTGSWNGMLTAPDLGYIDCPAQTRAFNLTLTEDANQDLSGSYLSGVRISGHRSGNALTFTVTTSFGARGPYTWTWNGSNTITGSIPWFCYHSDTHSLVNESTASFTASR